MCKLQFKIHLNCKRRTAQGLTKQEGVGEDGLLRNVIVCPAVTLAAWILHWSTQSVKKLIFAIVGYPQLLSAASLLRQSLLDDDFSNKHFWIIYPRPTLVSEEMHGVLAYQWWVSHSLASGLDKCLISGHSLGKTLMHPIKRQVNGKASRKRWEWLKSSFDEKQGFHGLGCSAFCFY